MCIARVFCTKLGLCTCRQIEKNISSPQTLDYYLVQREQLGESSDTCSFYSACCAYRNTVSAGDQISSLVGHQAVLPVILSIILHTASNWGPYWLAVNRHHITALLQGLNVYMRKQAPHYSITTWTECIHARTGTTLQHYYMV